MILHTMSNGKQKKKKTIGLDARFYGPLGKGLGRYTQEIVDRVTSLDQENDYVVFLKKENYNEFKPPRSGVRKILVDARWYSLWEQLAVPYYVWREKIDLMHFPHFNVPVFCPSKFVVTIHDLILTKFSTARASTLGPLFYGVKNFIYRLVIWLAIKRSRRIFAVSEFTKNDIIRQFSVRPEKIAVTYEGVALSFESFSAPLPEQDIQKVLSSYGIGRPFLLYVGNAYPHKNLEGLLAAYREAAEEGLALSLVLVGKEDYFYKRLKKIADDSGLFSGKRGEVIFPGYVPDKDLKFFYAAARAYIFPSFYEGFGLPPLEAMANGCPVASSDQASLPEILGSAALYFNPYEKEDLKRAMKAIAADQDLRRDLVVKGHERAARYSWEQCARATVGVYGEMEGKKHK